MLASSSPRVSVRKTTSTLRKERERSTQQGSVSSLPPYSELYSPISSKGARLELGILEREESDGEEEEDHDHGQEEGEREGRAHQGTTPTPSSTLPATTHILLSSPSPSTRSFNLTPSRSASYTSYHLTSPRPQPPPAINTSSSSLLTTSSSASLLEESSSDEGSFESPVTQLDRLLLRSSSALAAAQTLLSGTLTARGSLLDLDERGREGDDSLSRIDVETRLRTRRDSELYTTRIDPLFNSISLLLSDLERQTPYVSSYATHPLRTRLSAVGTSLGSVQQVDASYTPSSNPSHQRSNSHINLPSSPNGGPDDSSSVQPPLQSPATSLLHSLHGRTSSVSSGKSFFLSPPPSSPISRFAFPTSASSLPTQMRFPSTTSTSSSTSTSKDRTPNALSRDRTPTTSTTTFSSPPQPRSSHPTPSLHPSPSLDRMPSSSSSTANSDATISPTRSRTVSTSAALFGGSSSNRDSANVDSLTLQIPFSSASATSSSSRHSSPSPSEADEDALLTSLPPPSLSGPVRHRRSQSPLPHSSTRSTPPSAFRTSASPSPTPVSATTTPTMSTVSLPSTGPNSDSSPAGGEEKKGGQVGSAVLGNESVAMARLRSLGALKPAAAAGEGSPSSTSTSSDGTSTAGSETATGATKKWGVPGWFGS